MCKNTARREKLTGGKSCFILKLNLTIDLFMKKIVIKLGSSSLTDEGKKLSRRHMAELVRQICRLHDEGNQIVLVSSGAIAAGRHSFKASVDSTLPTKQMLASIGQVRLMHAWSDLFGIYDVTIGQVLLTRGDVSDEKRSMNAKNTFLTLLSHRAIPIVNENDTVATEEIRFGDNDTLSALVAQLIGADLLLLLTDQQGLYTADPRYHPEAKLIQRIETIDETVSGFAHDTPEGGVGTGGMATKIAAARLATAAGTATVIASSREPNVILNLSAGQPIGTLFLPRPSCKDSL